MSFSKAFLLALLPTLCLAAVGRVKERQATTCSAVHLFLARGNGEPYPGRVGAMYNTICNGLSSCDYENIEFDSSQSYCGQASDGVSSGVAQITAYANACPNSKLVLAGYSLGAQIVGDILGGGGGSFYGCVESTSSGLSAYSYPGNKIAAVLLFGDVRHVANEPYNVGPGSGANGQYPRSGSSLSILNQYSNIMQSYCLSTDPICALGDDGLSHTTYMTVYASSAGAWAQQVLGGGAPAAPPSSSTPSPPPPTSTTPVAAPSITPQTTTPTTSSPVTTTTPVTTTSSASHTTSTSSVNTATFSPFNFSNIATAGTTSIYTSASVLTTATTIATTVPSSQAAVTSTSSKPPVSTKSKGGAHSNGAQITLNLVTLIVIKVLTAF